MPKPEVRTTNKRRYMIMYQITNANHKLKQAGDSKVCDMIIGTISCPGEQRVEITQSNVFLHIKRLEKVRG